MVILYCHLIQPGIVVVDGKILSSKERVNRLRKGSFSVKFYLSVISGKMKHHEQFNVSKRTWSVYLVRQHRTKDAERRQYEKDDRGGTNLWGHFQSEYL
jgi:hypothetical protein